MIIGGVVGAVLIALVLLLVSGDKTGSLRQQMSARNTATLSLMADGKKNIKSADLAKLNSELYLVLLTDDAATSKALTTAGLGKLDPSVKTAEAVTTTIAELKTAEVNGQYDSVYKTGLEKQLTSLNSLSKQLHSQTTSKSLKAALSTQYTHVAQFLEALKKL